MKVSVVIPCFNREKSLGDAITSALRQTLPAAEIVVVDDGSTDGSAAVAECFGPPVRVIRRANGGAAAARNRGIAEATGDWIAFLDSDDVWAPEKLQRQAAAAEVFPEADVVFCDTVVKEGECVRIASRFGLGGVYGREIKRKGPFALYDRSLFVNMLEQSRCITSAVLVRRELAELRFPEHIWGSEDWALWLTLALRYRFASVDETLVTMYVAHDNLTRNTSRVMRNDVATLKDILCDAVLDDIERREVRRALQRRRVAAAYHSLVRGETRETRRLLMEIPMASLPGGRWTAYWLGTFLPKRVVRTLARWRLRQGVDGSKCLPPPAMGQ